MTLPTEIAAKHVVLLNAIYAFIHFRGQTHLAFEVLFFGLFIFSNKNKTKKNEEQNGLPSILVITKLLIEVCVRDYQCCFETKQFFNIVTSNAFFEGIIE